MKSCLRNIKPGDIIEIQPKGLLFTHQRIFLHWISEFGMMTEIDGKEYGLSTRGTYKFIRILKKK